MRRITILEAGVALATVLSLGMLGLLLAAPILPSPTAELPAAPSPTPEQSDIPDEEQPPLGLLQVVDTSSVGGQGLVFDRVEAIGPPLDPLPSPTPVALQPNGLFLLRGPFSADGPCLVLELGVPSYPRDPNATGGARIRWWERAVADPGNPAECLSRAGDVREVSASVVAVRDPNGTPIAYSISFSVPLPATGAMQDVEISVLLDESTQEQLHAAAVTPEGGPPMVFDRVDSIDPPLAPTPSDSAGA